MSSIDWRTLICDSIMEQRRTSKEILVGWFKLPTKAWCDFLVTDVMLEQSVLSIVGRWSTQTETKHGLPTGFFKDVQLFFPTEREMEGNLLLSLQSGSALPLVFSYKNSRPIARWLFTAAVGSLLLLLLLGSGGFFLCVRFNRQRWMMSVISIAFGMWSLLKIPDDMENDIISGNESEMEPKKRNIYAMNYYRFIFKKNVLHPSWEVQNSRLIAEMRVSNWIKKKPVCPHHLHSLKNKLLISVFFFVTKRWGDLGGTQKIQF